jgi:uncharacterized lipoprotein YajG
MRKNVWDAVKILRHAPVKAKCKNTNQSKHQLKMKKVIIFAAIVLLASCSSAKKSARYTVDNCAVWNSTK